MKKKIQWQKNNGSCFMSLKERKKYHIIYGNIRFGINKSVSVLKILCQSGSIYLLSRALLFIMNKN